MKITKTLQISFLRGKIASNPDWAKRALLKIYENQTATEQDNGHTIEDNGIGFSGSDSAFLSSLAEQLKTRGTLSDKQTASIQKLMPKYSKQILAITDEAILNSMILKSLPMEEKSN